MMLPILSKLLQFLGFPESIRPVAGAIGQTLDKIPQPVIVPARHPVRHTLITGANGHGASLAVRRILANQIATGGGLIVIDAAADESQRYQVKCAAREHARDTDTLFLGSDTPHWTKDGLEIPEVDFAEVIARNKIVYITLPVLGKQEQAIKMGKKLSADLADALPNLPHHASPGCLVAVLNGMGCLPEDPAPLLKAASEQNVTVLVRDSYTRPFGEANNPLGKALRDLTWTKISFREHGLPQAANVAALLTGSLSRPLDTVSPYLLHTLGLGEFILVQGDAIAHAKLYPVNIP